MASRPPPAATQLVSCAAFSSEIADAPQSAMTFCFASHASLISVLALTSTLIRSSSMARPIAWVMAGQFQLFFARQNCNASHVGTRLT